jgi:pimeloyl-ACP methyl ester carboxylesterase
MKRISRWLMLFGLAIALAISPTLSVSSQTSDPGAPLPDISSEKRGTYETTACSTLFAARDSDAAADKSPIPDYGDEVEGTDYECGYLTVPEVHSQPDSALIQVGIVIIKSTNPNPAEPLFLFQGGPGGSSIALFPSLFLPVNETSEQILSERDVIIFEKRGNPYSQPYLNCPEYQEDDVNFTSTATEQTLSSLAVCRDRLVQEGINLEAFNSAESADDVAALALALGYERINLYGVSYGTELAQDVLRLHPEMVRSVILDGVVPGNPSVDSQYAVILDRLITQVDEACAEDADCHALYPDVKGTFEATYERLNMTPGTVELSTSSGIKQQPVTGLNLAHTIFEMSYSSGAPFVIPAMIYQASEDEFGIIAQQRYLHAGGGGMSTMTAVLHTPNFFLGFDRVLVGIDRSFAWIYAIPIAIALVSMAMVGLAVIAWRNGYWDKRRRIYYGVTAGMAIAYTLFLANAGQLTVFL